MPPVAGVTRNADVKLNRSSRIGLGDGTITPFGSAITTVMLSYGLSGAFEKLAAGPSLVAVSHGNVAPNPPLKHAICVMSAGACTTALACSIGTAQSLPTTFQ